MNATPPITCSGCQTQIAPGLLSCPACQRLVYADRLNELAATAQSETAAGNLSGAVATWRDVLPLLPQGSQQHQAVAAEIIALSNKLETTPQPAAPASRKSQSGASKAATGIGAVALLLWKLKFALLAILSKGKLLLLGLTKAGTLFSMLLSLGVYWTIWGWPFALGLVLSIYIHEMGHVAALRRFGFRATAPMFIPGLGAVIRLQQQTVNEREDARIGLAGPIWGLGAAVAAAILWVITDQPIFGAIARVGAWINLFNLLPLFPLDGGRGFRALSRTQSWIAVAALVLMWLITSEGLLILLIVLAVVLALKKTIDSPEDRTALLQYIGLVVCLSLLSQLRIPMHVESDVQNDHAQLQPAASPPAQPAPDPHSQS